MACRLASPTMFALPMSPGFRASCAWIRACSSAAFLAFSIASFMKVAACEGWMVLPIGRRSCWDEEETLGCKKKNISIRCIRSSLQATVGRKRPRGHLNPKRQDFCPLLPGCTCGAGGLMKLSCFFLSSI